MKDINQISKRNKRGIVVLVFLMLFVLVLPRTYDLFKKDEVTITIDELEEQVVFMKKQKATFIKNKKEQKNPKYKSPPSKFNPNEYSLEDWMYIGLSEKQAMVLLSYAKKRIKNNDELKQIFVINDEVFNLLKDSTIYDNTKEQLAEIKTKPIIELVVNLNIASKEELLKLPGIGDFYASKIIEYREKLGGYHSETQLLELWKFTEEKLDKIKNHIQIDTTQIKTININTCTTEDLVKHPYINWNIANSIVKIRKKNQKFSNINQVLESELINRELFEKLKYYFVVEN